MKNDTYDLSSFAGRLMAVADGETLTNTFGKSVNLDNIINEACYLRSELPFWSLVTKPEKFVMVTRKQLMDAYERTHLGGLNQDFQYLAWQLGLGEET